MTWNLALSRRVLCLSFVAVLALPPLGCRKEEAAKEGEEDHAAPVKWEKVEKADLEEWTELLGTTQPMPNRVARVSAAVEGHVLSVLPAAADGKAIVEGQRIDKGQILVQLDERIPRANRAKLAAGDAELKELTQQARNAVDLAQLDIDRLEKLLTPSTNGSVPLVSRIELDKARLALKDAESKHKVARAKEAIARAELKAIDEQLSLYTLRTPIAGQLGMVHAVPGQTLPIGAVVAEVIDLDEIDVLCFVPARRVAHLRLDQPVRIEETAETEGDVSKVEQGHIVFISDQAQAEIGTIAVKARFPNRNRKLRTNMLLRVRVLTHRKTECPSLPESALLEDQEDTSVLVVRTEKEMKDGKEEEEHHVHKYQVELGLRDRDKRRVEILGLKEVKDEKKTNVPLDKEMLFVVEGGHGLEDGDKVKEKKEEKEDEHKEGDK